MLHSSSAVTERPASSLRHTKQGRNTPGQRTKTMTIETTFSKPPRLNDRRSIHNADNSATCRRELEAEGWQFVQPWTPPAVDEELAVLLDNERRTRPTSARRT
jgi:hypothetical protein